MGKQKGKKEKKTNPKYIDSSRRSILQQALYDSHAPRELIEKVKRDVRRGQFSYLTPYLLSERYTITISTAKKVLKELVAEGVITLYSPGRRSPLYAPVSKK